MPLVERSVIKLGKARLTFHLADLHANRIKPVSEENIAKVERTSSDPLQAILCPHCGTWLSTATAYLVTSNNAPVASRRLPCRPAA